MGTIHPRTIVVGSRPSRLARWQSEYILDQLKAGWPGLTYQMVTMATQGDKTLDRPLPEIGGKGVFTAELEAALRSGEIDLAVHSLKDLPVADPDGLVVAAISRRADARDVLISASRKKLMELAPRARVGTSSLRRMAQLKAARPDLEILPLRGNVDTRLRKALQGEYDAIVLAAAGLDRLELSDAISEHLAFEVMLPAPGQGALAVQCREEDGELRRLLQGIHHEATAQAVSAERAFLAGLGGGCSAPVAAYAQGGRQGLEMSGLAASLDGRRVVRVRGEGPDAGALGQMLAQQALRQGAGDLVV